MKLGVLGPLELVVDGHPVILRASKLRLLLAMLAASANRVVSADQLADALWGDHPPPTAHNTLQGYVYQLRRVLEPSRRDRSEACLLVTHDRGYLLALAPEQLDSNRFESLAAEARSHLATAPAVAARLLREALALWRGPALVEVMHVASGELEASRLEAARLGAAEDRCRAELALGHHTEVINDLAALVRAHPLHEQLAAMQMVALYRSGRQAEALRAYERVRSELAEGLGVIPSPDLARLEQAVLLHEPSLDWLPPPLDRAPAGGRPGVIPTATSCTRWRSRTFVGRQAERATLEVALAEASDGQPSVVLVTGEAGVGKTRLVGEVMDMARGGGASVLTGGASGLMGGQVPFAPLAEALRHHLGSRADSSVDELVAVSQGALLQVLPELGSHEGEAPRCGSARLQGLLLRSFAWLARDDPVALVLEDLHWADASTAALVEFLARNLSDQRLVVVVTVRTDALNPRHLRWDLMAGLERSPLLRRIDLFPLNLAEVSELVEALLGRPAGVPLAEELAARSQGNPLFVEELVAAHREQRSLRPTFREMLVARTQDLGPAAKAALRVLAVAARPLEHAVLVPAAGLDEAALVTGLRAAADRGVVLAEGDTYRFSHALVGEAVAADLLAGERMALHARLATSLQSAGAAAAEVAHHWLAAGDLSQALPALVGAAAAAERALAWGEADAFYEQAAELWDRVPGAARRSGVDRAWLFERAAEAALLTDRSVHAGSAVRYQRAIDLSTAALAHLDPTSEPARAGLLHARLGALQWSMGGDGAARWDEAMRLLPAEPPTVERGWALALVARGLLESQRYRQAIPLAEEAIAMSHRLKDQVLESSSRTTLGTVIGYLGDVDGATAHLGEAMVLAESAGATDEVMRAHNLLWAVLWANDRHEEGLAVTRRTEELGRRLGVAEAVRPAQLYRTAMALQVLGRWDECDSVLAELEDRWPNVHSRLLRQASMAAARGEEPALGKAIRQARSNVLSIEEASMLVEAEAQLALWRSRPVRARELVDGALRKLASFDAADLVGPLCLLGIQAEADRADTARSVGSSGEADQAVARAGPLVDRLRHVVETPDLPPWTRAVAATAEAEATRARGRSDVDRWQEAVRAWAASGRIYPLACAQWRCAEAILLAGGSRSEAAGLARTSRATADRLRLKPLAARLDSLARQHRLPQG